MYFTKYLFMSEYEFFSASSKILWLNFDMDHWYTKVWNMGGLGGGGNNTHDIFSFWTISFTNKISQSLSKVFYSMNRSLPSILAGESSVTKSRKPSLTGALHYVTLCTGIIRAFDLGSFWIWQLPVLKSRHFTITFALWKQSGHLEEVKSGYYQSKYFLMRRLRLQL